MKLTIHRGADQIGGSIIEVASGRTRIILDVGSPLPGPGDASQRRTEIPPKVPGLWCGDTTGPCVDAVLISHVHADHCGLLHQVRSEIPVFMSSGSYRLLETQSLFTPRFPPGMDRCKVIDRKYPITIGDLTVTAYPVDHSAFDSRAFAVTDGSKRLVYSGDLRAHGRTARRFEFLKESLEPKPDVLLLEGTRVGRKERGPALQTEEDVEKRFRQLIQDWPGPVLIAFSPLNIDRLVSAFKAARVNDRDLVVDPYAAIIMNSLGRWPNIPKTHWKGIRVWFPRRITDWMRGFGLGKRIEALRRDGLRWTDLTDNPDRYVCLFRPSMAQNLPDWGHGSARLIYSMWTGYLDRSDWREAPDDPPTDSIEKVHVSGHAALQDLVGLCRAVKPKRVIPVHTAAPDGFADLFPEADPLSDGEVLELL